jgi:hypothetical protein
MKPRLLLIPAMLVATAALADTRRAPSAPADAQTQAAALLSRPQAPRAWNMDDRGRQPTALSAAVDPQAKAAALLSGLRPGGQVKASLPVARRSAARMSVDAQAQAAALLSGSRISADSQPRGQRTLSNARAREKQDRTH